MCFLLGLPVADGSQRPQVVFWHHYNDEQAQFWEDMATEFGTQYDIEVTVQHFPSYTRQHDAILSGLVNGTLPDAALVRNYDAALYQLSDSLLDLSSLSLNPEVFYPEIWAQDIYRGQRLGVPLTRGAVALYVNMDALHEIGYDAPPQTRDELAVMACAFHAAGGWSEVQSIPAAAFDVPLEASFYFAMSQPAELLTDAGFNFMQPQISQTIAWMQDVVSQGCAELQSNQIPASLTRFAAGQTLFYVASSDARPTIEAGIGEFFALPFEIAAVPIPAQDGPVVNLTGPSLSVFRSTPPREAAARTWVEWLAGSEQVLRWAQMSHTLPARRDVNINWGDFGEGMRFTELNLPGYDIIRDEFSLTVQAVLEGASLETALVNLTRTANEIRTAFMLE